MAALFCVVVCYICLILSAGSLVMFGKNVNPFVSLDMIYPHFIFRHMAYCIPSSRSGVCSDSAVVISSAVQDTMVHLPMSCLMNCLTLGCSLGNLAASCATDSADTNSLKLLSVLFLSL